MADEKDLFICHASEDKRTFVRPLAKALQGYGARVWYDEFSLSVGDSLSRTIDRGLATSRYAAVVLSKSFFAKRWPEYELRGLVAKELSTSKVILPIWLGVEHDEVLAFSPPLADKLAILATGRPIREVAVKLLEIARPDIFQGILRDRAWRESLKNAYLAKIDPRKVRLPPVRHASLSPELVSRIRLIRAALLGGYPHSMQNWIDGFKRDTHPEREVAWWEHVAAAFLEFVQLPRRKTLTRDQHKAAFAVIFGLCNGDSRDEVKEKLALLPRGEFKRLAAICRYATPPFDIEEPLEFE